MTRRLRRWARRNNRVLQVLAACGLVLVAWWIFFRPPPPPPLPKVWTLFLVDISQSTWGASASDYTSEIRTQYKSEMEQVLSREESSLYAFDVIDSNPLAHGELTPYAVPSCEGLSYLDCQDSRERAKATFVQAFTSLAQTRMSGTDIRGGLYLASRFFASDTTGACHRLIVFSDMLLRQKGIAFADEQTWDRSVIELIDEVGPPPLLTGVDVYLVGLGRSGDGQFRNGIELDQFWRAYFELAGAHVRSTLATLPATYPYPCPDFEE